MANEHSIDDLLDFLSHAGERGLMPVATAQALAVASRKVFEILTAEERADVRKLDLEGVIKRFTNKRAKEFNPSSLREYGRRVHRAVELFLKWRGNPAEFTVTTRVTDARKKKARTSTEVVEPQLSTQEVERVVVRTPDSYDSSFPVRPGRIVTIANIPEDLSATEAERLAQFIKMLPTS